MIIEQKMYLFSFSLILDLVLDKIRIVIINWIQSVCQNYFTGIGVFANLATYRTVYTTGLFLSFTYSKWYANPTPR